MAPDPDLWKKLKPGDRVRVFRYPTFDGYVHPETAFVYEWLVSRKHVLTIEYLEEIGGISIPWCESFSITTYSVEASHYLALDHDGLGYAA